MSVSLALQLKCHVLWARVNHPLRRLHFCFNIVAVHPSFINCYDIFQKVFVSIRTIKEAPDWLCHSSLFVHLSADAAQILQQHDASSVCRLKSGGTNFYRFLPLRQLHRYLGDDFDKSQQALSQRDRSPLTWKAVQIWGHLWWTFCPIWNAGTTRDIAYNSNNPLHKSVAISEKSL